MIPGSHRAGDIQGTRLRILARRTSPSTCAGTPRGGGSPRFGWPMVLIRATRSIGSASWSTPRSWFILRMRRCRLVRQALGIAFSLISGWPDNGVGARAAEYQSEPGASVAPELPTYCSIASRRPHPLLAFPVTWDADSSRWPSAPTRADSPAAERRDPRPTPVTASADRTAAAPAAGRYGLGGAGEAEQEAPDQPPTASPRVVDDAR